MVGARIVVVRDLDTILERLTGPNVQEDVVGIPAWRDVEAVKMEIRRLLQTIVEGDRQGIAGLEAPDWRYVGIVVQHALEPLAADHVLVRCCRQVDVKLAVPPDEDLRRRQSLARSGQRHLVVRKRRAGHDQRDDDHTKPRSHLRCSDGHVQVSTRQTSHESGCNPGPRWIARSRWEAASASSFLSAGSSRA
jgi:hypothetical protein